MSLLSRHRKSNVGTINVKMDQIGKKEQKFVIKEIFKDKKRGNPARAYGSLVFEKLKGGIESKIYYEMLSPNKYSEHPAYVKLVFPDKTEISFPPSCTKEQLADAIERTGNIWIGRFEFEKKGRVPKYLYLLRAGDQYFDLPESFAKGIAKKANIEIHLNSWREIPRKSLLPIRENR